MFLASNTVASVTTHESVFEQCVRSQSYEEKVKILAVPIRDVACYWHVVNICDEEMQSTPYEMGTCLKVRMQHDISKSFKNPRRAFIVVSISSILGIVGHLE